MGKGKKPFIDRKKAVTFHLVHRSQHDPLVADENAPQHVLVEATNLNQQDIPDPQHNSDDKVDVAKRQEELHKYGIHFDDEYDYLQHLKERDQEIVWEYVENPNHSKKIAEAKSKSAAKLQLPSSVFASEYEEEIGMLNKAAPHPGPRPDWDPDVVAALDDDFDHNNEDNQLEDDFILKAMGDDGIEDENENKIDEEENEEWSDIDEGDEDFDSDDLNESDDEKDDELMDRLAPLMREKRFADEETKSRFTEYSMTSSVIRRNEQLTFLDDRFEKFYASYDDPELGDLAMEDIEGNWHQKHPVVMNCFKEFKKGKKDEPYNKEWDRLRLERYRMVADGDQDPDEELIEYEVIDPKEQKWDCESILTTNSNIYNRPKLIDEPRKSRKNSSSFQMPQTKIEIDHKTGLPINVLRNGENNQLTAKALARLEEGDKNTMVGPKSLCAKSVLSTLSVLSIRPKDETPEEKKERKRLLKEYRNERRIERKANAEAFKEEKKRQVHVKLNQRNNQMGSKIV